MKQKNKPTEDFKLRRQIKREKKRKEKQKKKTIKLIKDIIIFVLIQVAIVYTGVIAFVGNVPVSIENTETFSFKADKVEMNTTFSLGRLSGKNRNIFIYHNTDKYLYQELFSYQYNGNDVQSDLQNEYLTVTCEKGTNRVVELKGENIIFYTIEDYNFSKIIRVILGIIVMFIIESLFLFILLFYVFFYYIPPVKVLSLKKLKFKGRKRQYT